MAFGQRIKNRPVDGNGGRYVSGTATPCCQSRERGSDDHRHSDRSTATTSSSIRTSSEYARPIFRQPLIRKTRNASPLFLIRRWKRNTNDRQEDHYVSCEARGTERTGRWIYPSRTCNNGNAAIKIARDSMDRVEAGSVRL